jgi:hypothetical protein
MKAFPELSLKTIMDEIKGALRQADVVPVPVESKANLSPVELRRYVRNLRRNRQIDIY